MSLFWSCFKWFFSAGSSADASVASCGGFSSWPTFGFKALDLTWNFDSSLTYVGVGAPSRLCCNVIDMHKRSGLASRNRHKYCSQHEFFHSKSCHHMGKSLQACACLNPNKECA